MAFTLRRTSTASPQRLWDVVSDLGSHGRYFPATTMTTDEGPPRVGWGFVGRSGVGRAAFLDTMTVIDWEPPNRFRMVKLGPVLLGWADVSVEPDPAGSALVWTESALPRGFPRVLGGLGDRLGIPFYERVLTAIVAEAERTPR